MGDENTVMTLEDAMRQLDAGVVSATELARRCLARIEEVDPRVRAFVTITRERALADAAAAEARIAAGEGGPLTGAPIALKDLVATRGIRTTAGSRALEAWVPDEDAPIAAALARAGTVLLGKTNTHEFAYGTFTPPTRNPWDLDRVPGGSSGGSAAAVAAGECLGAVGTDTGGSIRIPSACCGVTGLKPTYGLVNTAGIVPLSWSLDHAGPIARSVRDCALLLDALVEDELFEPVRPVPGVAPGAEMRYADATDDTAAVVAGMRLGVPSNYFFAHVEPEVEAAVRGAIRVLAALGAEIVEVRVPHAVDDLFAMYRAVQRSEALTAHTDAGWYPALADRYTPRVRAALERASDYTTGDYIRAQRAKAAFAEGMEAVFSEVNALITPTLPIVAPRVAELDQPLVVNSREDDVGTWLLRLTFPLDMSGQPALTVPCGFTSEGMPVGMQIVARRFDEATVLRVGQAYQRDTNWHLRVPRL